MSIKKYKTFFGELDLHSDSNAGSLRPGISCDIGLTLDAVFCW